MALENSSEDNSDLKKIEDKDTSNTNRNEDPGEEQHITAPGICDICAEFYHFLVSVERRLHIAAEENDEDSEPVLKKDQLSIMYQYLGIWVQRQCLCIYRDQKNIERFALAIQCLTCICVSHLKNLRYTLKAPSIHTETYTKSSSSHTIESENSEKDRNSAEKECLDEEVSGSLSSKNQRKTSNRSGQFQNQLLKSNEQWTVDETERMLQYMAKVFMMQFPLYSGPKQAGQRNEEVSTGEGTQLAVYCDVHDSSGDFPIILLRNVTLFCKSGGLQGMADAFCMPPSHLPPSMAHALISVLCNIKMWLNYRALLQLFTPVRTNALHYMCQLNDGDLRAQAARHIADFLWSSAKENMIDSSNSTVGGSSSASGICFDKDGLDLAFKYFNCTTLTMRLTGITQINSHISLFNEMCNTESVVEVENVGLMLAEWILNNRIVEHIFGPNLHVEVIKQCHILLNFLAVEGKVSNQHITVIWQAAQLKHCSKQVHDLLLPLIKNLEAGPVLHLYELMKELPIKEHTEQTIHLAQILQKFIWTSGGTFSHLLQEANALQNAEKIAALSVAAHAAQVHQHHHNTGTLKSNRNIANLHNVTSSSNESGDSGELTSRRSHRGANESHSSIHTMSSETDEEEEDEEEDHVGVSLKQNSSNSRQEAAKAAQAVMTAAAVMLASKQAGKNKNTTNQPDMRMAPLSNLKHSLKSDDEDDQEIRNDKQFKKISHRRYQGHYGHHQTQENHSYETEEYNSVLQDYSDNDLEDEEDEDEEEEDMEEEECHEEDNTSSNNCEEDDPRLCSPLNDLENQNSHLPKTNKSTRDISNQAKLVKSKLVRARCKSESPENKSIDKICPKDVKRPFEGQNSNKKDVEQKYPTSDLHLEKMTDERAKSLPPEGLSQKQNVNKYDISLNLNKRKRKSRPSSSPMLESNSEKEKYEENSGIKISFDVSPDKSKLKNKRVRKNDGKTQTNSEKSSNYLDEATLKANNERTNQSVPDQIESELTSVTTSNKTSNPVTEARNVWWANAENHPSSLSVETTGGDQTSSVGSAPMISPEVSIGQWPTNHCVSPSQSGCCSNAQAAALAAAAVASNSAITPPPPGPSTAMAELANLVNAHPRAGVGISGETVHDMRPFLRNLAAHQQRWSSVEDNHGGAGNNVSCGISDDNDSVSSRLSNKSDKNLADFEDENSVDEEMLQLAQSQDIGVMLQHQQLASMASFCQQRQAITAPRLTVRQQREGARLLAHYTLDTACQPGQTLLWDLIQDRNIEQLADGLAAEAEKALTSLLCFNMERFIRMKFIEGCLSNIAKNESVAISLRLLPKLFQSFQNFRGMDTHEVSMFAEKRHGMMRLFFNNLQEYRKQHIEGKQCPPFFNHLAQIQTRLQFLGVIFSIQVSPPDFHLNNAQINTLWECLAADPVCSDDFFQWLLVQVHSKEQHAIALDGFRLIYNDKLPMLKPETISMLGLNLFSQLCQLSNISRTQPQALSNITINSSQGSSDNCGAANSIKMDQLWRIALCAQNTDVSMKAIQILNSAYFSQGEEFLKTCMRSLKAASDDLWQACISQKNTSTDKIVSSSANVETCLIRIQRALLLLKTYLETFRRKYAYHFRRMSIDGQGVSTHAELVDLRTVGPLRILVQTAGFQDKVTFDMQATDLIADLRAEITAWWEGKLSQLKALAAEKQQHHPLLGSILNEGTLRLITQGQEVSHEADEKSLLELGFKDFQVVFVSQGANNPNRSGNRGNQGDCNIAPFPGKDNMPMNLLLLPVHFDQLFSLMQRLSDMRLNVSHDREHNNGQQNRNSLISIQSKAQILSRRVWDILMLLPTSPHLKEKLQHIRDEEDESCLKQLLSPESPQKLMYTLYIVDWLGRPARLRRHSGLVEPTQSNLAPLGEKSINDRNHRALIGPWIQRFIKAGGLRHLFSIFLSGDLQPSKETGGSTGQPSGDRSVWWCEWKQDCLSALLKLLVQFGVDPQDYEVLADQMFEGTSTPRKRMRRYNTSSTSRKASGASSSSENIGRLLVPRLSRTMLELMEVQIVVPRINSVLLDVSAVSKDGGIGGGRFYLMNPIYGSNSSSSIFGRVQLVHFSVSLLVSWMFSVNHEANKLTPVHDALFSSSMLTVWLRNLLLEDHDPSVRRELCTGLYKMCLGSTTSGKTGLQCTGPLLSVLLELLDDALAIKPIHRYRTLGTISDISSPNIYTGFANTTTTSEEGKEAFGPACRDYFWNLCRLVDNLGQINTHIINESKLGDDGCTSSKSKKKVVSSGPIDLDNLARRLVMGLVNRQLYEKRHGHDNQPGSSDDMLVGSLNLLCCVMKHQPPFKSSPEGQAFLAHLLDYLFALPNPREKNYPKCKSMLSRTACYDLIVEMAKGCLPNYLLLHAKLLEQHDSEVHKPYPWEYWPKDDGRSECGYVGLTNLGATCYMASCMQQLYMIPQARSCILSSDAASAPDGKHLLTLQELQKMFAYLQDSERKAYNPLSFCKTYQMDHALLNTGEQKDMAEFFIDLLSKMEEMGPDLKKVVKELFCGTLTNNVVSLDCCHVSRTAEEFYTVRCQVSEMRNLYQSLEEVTVKDTLEGDNMYTCSQCNKKVRAEKRACFKQLPKILAFNTMRYTFNMITMLKEKVNTHFSFPFRLDMSPYLEHNLIPNDKQDMTSCSEVPQSTVTSNTSSATTKSDSVSKEMTYTDESENKTEGTYGATRLKTGSNDFDSPMSYEYELIGVTVHTGTADGGHYYAFIRDRTGVNSSNVGGSKSSVGTSGDKWYSFNDAEVKQFDPSQIATECFGGEMNSRTYDQGTDKFMDLSIEKTNSAYMLFYERIELTNLNEAGPSSSGNIVIGNAENREKDKDTSNANEEVRASFNLSENLEEWIWKDNMNFIQDNNIFDHTYFNFMWQMVGYIPTTLNPSSRSSGSNVSSASHSSASIKFEKKNSSGDFNEDITLLSAKLATSFFLESFIHAKEKLNIVQWVELLTKQFDSSTSACAWLLNHMAEDNNWPVTIFLKCQVATIRQMFHRLCIHVIQKLRPMEKDRYYLPWSNKGPHRYPDKETAKNMGTISPIAKFIKMLLTLLETGVAKPYLKHLTELFRFLFDFAKLGEEEAQFLLTTRTISIFVDFYLKAIKQSPDSVNVDVVSDDDDEEDDDIMTLAPISESKKLASLEKMIHLMANLVEKSRGDDNRIHLARDDVVALAGNGHGDGSGGNSSSSCASSSPFISTGGGSRTSLIFLFNITKDNINMCQTCNLIFSLTRNNHVLAEQVAAMVFHGVKQPEVSMHFFRLLTLLTEFSGGPTGQPCYTNLVMHKVWDLAKTCPQAALDWLSIQANRNRYVQSWLVSTMENWVEQYLIAHQNQKVRNSAAFLVVSLVPSAHFRQAFRSARGVPSPQRETLLSRGEETECLHQILEFLYGLLQNLRQYTDLQQHGSGKLVAYFQTMTHFLLTRSEKLMFGSHFGNLWQLFHPKLSEPSIPVHHNKQALLSFWYNVCLDCPENIQLILQNPQVTKNIAFNYILADHEDTDVVNFNRMMLPTYYGLLRMCCTQSKTFTRQLAQHQNLQWAFKNITPYTTQYTLACDELFKLMSLFVQKGSEQQNSSMSKSKESSLSNTKTSEEHILGPATASSKPPSPDKEATPKDDKETTDNLKNQEKNLETAQEIRSFRQQALQLYLTTLDGRSSWNTLINALKILVEGNEDRLFVVYNNGLALIFESFNMLHMMFHEATACHVTEELVELCTIFLDLIKAVRMQRNNTEITQILSRWKDMGDMTNRLLTLINSFTPPELREVCILAIKEMLMLWPPEMLNILVPVLHRAHSHASDTEPIGLGQFFPRRMNSSGSVSSGIKSVRPPRPILQMFVPSNQLEAHHGQDPEYDRSLHRYFVQYHGLIDLMVRLSVNEDNLNKLLVDLSAMVGLDGVPLHLQLFPKLWIDINNTQQIDRKFIQMLIQSHGFLEYVDAVLLDERSSLNNQYIFNFLVTFFPKVSNQVLTDQVLSIINQLVRNFIDIAGEFNLTRANPVRHLNGDLRALLLVSTTRTDHLTPDLLKALKTLQLRVDRISEMLREKEELSNKKINEEKERLNVDVSSLETTQSSSLSSSLVSSQRLEDISKRSSVEKDDIIAPYTKNSVGIACLSDNLNVFESSQGISKICSKTRKRKTSDESNLKSEISHKLTKTTSDQKDSESVRLKEALITFAKTLALLTQVCNRAVNTHSDFTLSHQPIRATRTLSSTLAAAVRVASALSSSAVRPHLSSDDLLESVNQPSKELDKHYCETNKDEQLEVATSTPKKERDHEAPLSVTAKKDDGYNESEGCNITEHKDDNEYIPNKRVTRRSSQNK